jgi:hypothetical protein
MAPTKIPRRNVLRASLGVAAFAGAGAAGMVGAAPASADDGWGPPLPPVPGMHGDRRANEVWYQIDQAGQDHPSQEVKDAFAAIAAYVPGGPESGMGYAWWSRSKSPGYPDNYASFLMPIKEPIEVLSRLQLNIFDTYYRPRSRGLTAAFAYFGQGVLYDPRHTPPVHTMDLYPPQGYPIWHAYARAMMLLGIDPDRWVQIDPLIGFAWGLQAIADADPNANPPFDKRVNSPLPRETIRAQARYWLDRTPEELDTDFQAFPKLPQVS